MATLWFWLAALVITGYVLLDGFDLGAGVVRLFVVKSEGEASQVLSSIGPVWDGNEVWLLVAGGTLFLSFPTLLASAFSGFYLPLIIVCWLLILRGVSIEFHAHVEVPLWRSFWSTIFGLTSALLALLFGVALGNVVRGVPLDQSGYFFLPLWTNFSPRDQVGVIDWYTLLVGATSYLALAMHGSMWIVLKTEGSLQERTRSFGSKCWLGLAALTLLVSFVSFSIQPNLAEQFRNHPWGVVFPALALGGLIGTRVLSSRHTDGHAFLASCLYLMGMLASAAFGLFPKVLPANTAPEWSLTVYNAVTTGNGLFVGLIWFIPGIVLAITYSALVYRHFAGVTARHIDSPSA